MKGVWGWILLADDISADQSSAATQQAKDYYLYIILHKVTSYFSSTTTNQSCLQDQKPDTATVKRKGDKRPISQKNSYCRWWSWYYFNFQGGFRRI